MIRMKYLTSRAVKDLEVCEELGLKKDRYYKLKKQAMFNLPTALGIIECCFLFALPRKN
nr:hypothetical protein [Bacillus zhangzhouensis]